MQGIPLKSDVMWNQSVKADQSKDGNGREKEAEEDWVAAGHFHTDGKKIAVEQVNRDSNNVISKLFTKVCCYMK